MAIQAVAAGNVEPTNTPVEHTEKERPHGDTFLGIPMPSHGLIKRSPIPSPYLIEIGALNIPVILQTFPTATVTAMASLAINLQRSTYKETDEFVTKSPLRTTVTAELRQQYPGKEIRWVERYMLIKAGGGGLGWIPITPVVSGVVSGFLTGVAFGYYVRPIIVGVNDEAHDGPGTEHLIIPQSIEKVREMPIGAQFEITGLGTLNGACGIYIGPGAVLGPFIAGAFAGGGPSMQHTKGFSVAVSRLNDPDKARVQVREFNAASVGFNLFAQVGLLLGGNPLNIPAPGIGFIQHYTNTQGAVTMGALANQYSSFNFFVGRASNNESTGVAMYDYDMRNPEACKAMEDAIFRNLRPSQRLAANKSNTAVWEVRFDQKANTLEYKTGVLFCGEKAGLYSALSFSESGTLTYIDGSRMTYSDTAYKRLRESVFIGKKDIRWEHFLIKKDSEASPVHTYRLCCTSNDFYVSRQEALQFQRFADAIQVDYKADIDPSYPRLSRLEQFVRGAKPITTALDIFFTQTGIERIANCLFEDAAMTYIHAVGQLDAQYSGFSDLMSHSPKALAPIRAILKEAATSLSHCCIPSLGKGIIPKGLIQRYKTLSGGRDLKQDSLIWLLSIRFADAITQIGDCTDSQHISAFFTKLGQSKGFDYMDAILALRLIATKEHSLVHTLKMEGDHLSITSTDEGAIATPQEEVDRALNAI